MADRKRPDLDRMLRSLSLGVAGACAFAPSAVLGDAAPDGRTAARNLLAVAMLTFMPSVFSASAERVPEAEDLPRARFVQRFSPLAVTVVVVLTALFPYVARWGAIEAALVVQAPLAFFLYVPRVRAIHLLVSGWAAVASVALDDRALLGAAPFFALALVAAALDRALHVRTAAFARTPPLIKVPLAVSSIAATVFALVLGGTYAALPRLERWLPAAPAKVRMVRPPTPAEARTPILELLLAVGAVVVFFAVFRWLADRFKDEKTSALPLPPRTIARIALEPLDELAGIEAAAWPAGPRRALVRCYLEHLGRLARTGLARKPSEAPLDVTALVGRRAEAAREPEDRLARAFHRARYSPEPVSPEQLAAAEDAARQVEDTLS